MNFWVGTTDTRRVNFLAPRHLDEVNFWQPSVRPAFDNAPSGMPFVFKLKRPHNHIAGAGYFIARSVLPLDLAWEIFGPKNGAGSPAELRDLLAPLAGRGTPLTQITCQVIANPVFFQRGRWAARSPRLVVPHRARQDVPDRASRWRRDLGACAAAAGTRPRSPGRCL